jgi:hydroxylamine reductase
MQPVTVPTGTVKGHGLDFSELIEKARSLPELPDRPDDTVLSTGYSDNVVLSLSGTILSLVRQGKIRRIFLVGGCDAPGTNRQYYRQFVAGAPKDTLVPSWMEQKAVAILMGLFLLGVRGIYLGPTLPAWLTPGVVAKIQETFDLRLTSTPEADMARMLGG